MSNNEYSYIQRHAQSAFEGSGLSPQEWATFNKAYILGYELARDDAQDAGPRWNDK